ncbi:hypothetical protein C8J57DRAFT_1245827 [Mycena rebaudengoi]|nr:hypothetical protein C8J57DRAFT_1245827 [Mycena rebaudengoi]
MRTSEERMRLISQNPVAAARFFDFMTRSFIKNILGVGTDLPGLYGETDAYYGTVEQQGRLTLHMHMLVWIASALSPQEIRDKISAPDAAFQKSLVDYIESTHIGHFLTGTMEQVRARVPHFSNRSKGIHDILEDEDMLPVTPPAPCEFVGPRFAGTDLSKFQKPGTKIKLEVKGCTRSDGSCSARFPREVHLKTEVDVNDGSIRLKKLEPMVNNVTPSVTYVLGCNTDVTCLLSGTSIKAVVAYISDYVTKSSLKTYHVFQSVQNVFDRNTVCLGGSPETKKNARVLIMQMVNSLSSKLQVGSPMASMYLLGNPDHYTNLDFKVFWWKSYVKEVMSSGPSLDTEVPTQGPLANLETRPFHPSYNEIPSEEPERQDEDEDGDRVVVAKNADGFVGITNVDDYVSERKKISPKQHRIFLESIECDPSGKESSDIELDSQDNDPLDMDEIELDTVSETVPEISSDKRKLVTTVPNFAGGGLPRADQGDRDFIAVP